MSDQVQQLINQLNDVSCDVSFEQVMTVINANYHYQPTSFTNGAQVNQAGSNEGSCKIFAFAKLNGLSELATLNCFGKFYHEDVLNNPHGTDHGNIRNFMRSGWAAVSFEEIPLTVKS